MKRHFRFEALLVIAVLVHRPLWRPGLALMLTILTGLGGPVSLVVGQSHDDSQAASASFSEQSSLALQKAGRNEDVFVIYRDEKGESVCRAATPDEKRNLLRGREAGLTRTIYPGGKRPWRDELNAGAPAATESGTLLLPSAGLRIVLHGTQQLQNNPTARDAFIVAANRWEALISTPITVVLDVDFGTTIFGRPFSNPNTLGVTSSSTQTAPLSTVRQQLINNAPGPEDLQLYNALPATVPVELNGSTLSASQVRMTVTTSRTLGLSPDIPNPDAVPPDAGDAGIGFNSAHTFDFNPNDGITSGALDFDAIVVHEIGHALGFISNSGNGAATPLSIWDVFRFRPGTANLGTMATAPRVMSEGGTQVFFNNRTNSFGTTELGLSTGGSDGMGGDNEQSSHWKDDIGANPFIGIMDPTLRSGRREVLTDNDLRALDTFGYTIGGTAPPPPPPPPAPANDNFAAAVALNGQSGSTTGTNVGATGEAGEPDHAAATSSGRKSVWYNWTAPASGQTTFNTMGSNYDTVLGVYAGGAVNALSLIGSNDDVDTGADLLHSSVTFAAGAGTTYRLAVDGYQGETGTITLNWTGPAPTPTPTPVFNISGRVSEGSISGPGVSGVRINISVPPNVPAQAPVITNSNGDFQFIGLPGGGPYNLSPEDNRFSFSPGFQLIQNLSSNVSNTNFVAIRRTIDVSGRVIEGSAGLAGVTVWLLHQATQQASSTVTAADGTYQFIGAFFNDAYEVIPFKDGYRFSPPSLIIILSQSNLGDITATLSNPIDGSQFFVTKHYEDFFGRQPDAPGLAFWVNGINGCDPFAMCRQVKRIDTSAAFFLSIEFQETGYLVYRLYKAAYGDLAGGVPFPVRRAEFIPDTRTIGSGVVVGQAGWEQVLENNKQSFVGNFVNLTRFANANPTSTTPTEFVNTLFTRAGVTPSAADREAAVAEFGSALTSADAAARARALRKVAENSLLKTQEFNKAFVLMQYFGYLQRNPDDAPDNNLAGYNFWLTKLNQFNGDFRQAEMVKAFIASGEYRSRFGPP